MPYRAPFTTALTAAVLALTAAGASAQPLPQPASQAAEPFPERGRIDAPALSSTTRAAVQAEYIRARNAGEISPYDNHAEPFRLAAQPAEPATAHAAPVRR